MKQVGVGVIGCGAMGRSVLWHVLHKDPRIKVLGIYDPDSRSIMVTLKMVPGLKVYGDYRAMLEDPRIDWVMIASWNCYHREQVLASFAAGKHVFCQKPLGLNLKECVDMYRAWKKSGKMFNIGFTLRYSPHYRRIKELLAGGAVGKIISMEFNETLHFCHGGYIMGDWRRLTRYAGTHLLEKCCHDMDLANWMVDSMAERVASFGGLNFFKSENAGYIRKIGKDEHGRKAYCTWGGLIAANPFTSKKDIVDNQVAIIEYRNGARATFHTNCNAGIPERRMYILGSDGAIRADVLTGTIQVQRIGFGTKIEEMSTTGRGGHGGGDDVLAHELAQSMLRGKKPAVGLLEGLKSAVVCFAIDEAMDTERVVDVNRYWKKAGLTR